MLYVYLGFTYEIDVWTENTCSLFISKSDHLWYPIYIFLLLFPQIPDAFIVQAYDYWLNDMYMDVRLPLPINSNPGMVMPPRKFTTVHHLARFASQIIDNIMQYKEIIDK